ncbi:MULTISPECIES: ATP-binding protein [unclassified Streptomyces]|uniref:ATP-binding protein n=1 Tax=unclassified Streptomyces TaxID=2593676 RepID=UPI001BE9DBB0|nr:MULTISPECIES: ATP-binding protein [unclassified Streptomyces]MBT2404248.1 ATP-binding protein [Streptomyces sp. ISL-21]MBT2456285.1 ATP-binding protein [Streptomyces sp. ISL-86]MBT2612925.1 ATP-binding protein [Streptomyces sp. ISL-87]
MLTAAAQPAPCSPSPARSFVHWAAEPTAATVPQVRARVRAVLEGWRIAADAADTLLLAVSELVGNVVRHAAAATGRMRVGVSFGGGWLQLEVSDAEPSLPRLPGSSDEADPDAEAGRGLLLVHLLAVEAGGELAVTADEFGKSVRVRVPAA